MLFKIMSSDHAKSTFACGLTQIQTTNVKKKKKTTGKQPVRNISSDSCVKMDLYSFFIVKVTIAKCTSLNSLNILLTITSKYEG